MKPSLILSLFCITFFIACKKEKKESTTPIPSGPSTNTSGTWTNISPSSFTCNFSNMYATDVKLFATDGLSLSTSSDGGVSWTTTMVNNVWTILGYSNTVYSGRTDGFYVSNDSGATWIQKNNGLPGISVYKIATNGNSIYASTNPNSIAFTSDGGNNWSNVSIPSGTNTVDDIAVTTNGRVYATKGNTLFTSSNNGASWNMLNSGNLAGLWLFNLEASGNNILATTNGSVFISTDDGATWNGIAPLGVYVNIFAKGNKIIALKGIYLYYSNDSGASWVSFDDGLPSSRYISCVCLTGNSAYLVETNSKKVYKRTLN